MRSFHLKNEMVTIPANWLQILDSVTTSMRPVFAMVNLQPPVVVAAATPSTRSSQNFKTMDLVHLAHQNAKGKLIAAMSRLGHHSSPQKAAYAIWPVESRSRSRRTSHPVKRSAFLGLMFSSHVETQCGDLG